MKPLNYVKKEFDFISLGHGSKELPFFSNDIPLKSNYRFIKLSTPRNCTALAIWFHLKLQNLT